MAVDAKMIECPEKGCVNHQLLEQLVRERMDTLSKEMGDTIEEATTCVQRMTEASERLLAEHHKLEYAHGEIKQTMRSVEALLRSMSEGYNQRLAEGNIRFVSIEQKVANVQISSQDFSTVVENVLPAVVTVRTDIGQGSGAIVSSSGFIVTNFHVISGGKIVKVTTYDNKDYTSEIVG